VMGQWYRNGIKMTFSVQADDCRASLRIQSVLASRILAPERH
jgi:hypothetical protein